MPNNMLEEYTELETKYSANLEDLIKFKFLIKENCQINRTLIVEGPDEYFVKPNTDDFKRFRHAEYPADCGKEITTKKKREGSIYNINRDEKNLDVSSNDDKLIRKVIEDDGYEYNFTVWKTCHIYEMDDATLVFYTVIDITPGASFSPKSFIEIEINESIVHTMTTEQAKEIIKKYETLLEPLGINANKRLQKSLFERYRRKA